MPQLSDPSSLIGAGMTDVSTDLDGILDRADSAVDCGD